MSTVTTTPRLPSEKLFPPRTFAPVVTKHYFNPPRLCPYCNTPKSFLYSGPGLHGYLCKECLGEVMCAILVVTVK